jgi:2,3-bisphosphoglycerate-independent phosphoglycerate mutase
MGIPLGPDDWAIRCNLIYTEDGRLTDFTAGHITSEEGAPLLHALDREIGMPRRPKIEFHPGVSYRNLLVYRGTPQDVPFDETTVTTPPHDKPNQPAIDHLPIGRGAEILRELMTLGTPVVANHSVNVARLAAGKRPANTIWLWGQGKAPSLKKFADLHGIRGAIISAVDLVRGTGQLAGWDRIDVPGATGYLDTDYAAKGRAGIEALKKYDLVCVHVEAPDEASHEGRADAKIEALERIDRDIVGPLHSALKEYGEGRILISPDHATLLSTRAHDRVWVPWAIAGTGLSGSGFSYNEPDALAANGPFHDQGFRLMDQFLKKD